MPHLDKEFEAFLAEEANKHFKALPTDNHTEEVASSVQDNYTSRAYYKDFDIDNPPTSFNDKLLQKENISPAVSGNGRQPGLYDSEPSSIPIERTHSLLHVPFQETANDHLDNLNQVLQHFSSFKHTSQIPVEQQSASYYFLKSTKTKQETGKVYNPFGDTDIKSVQRLPTAFDVYAIRQDFPILQEFVNGKNLVWLDNAATTQKPQVVIDRISQFYKKENSNIHRAAHELAARATDAYEEARNIIKRFLNATSANEIVFTRGTTEAINLIANSWGDQHLSSDDEIIITHLEHHANIVPWQQLSKKKGFRIRVIPVDDEGNLLIEEYAKLLSPKTKLVSFTHVSNALGTITPVRKIIDLAHNAGAKVLLDGAQSVSHISVDLQELDPDFFVFSGHKIFGPTGIGVLYGKEDLLNSTQPYQSGGNMIRDVTLERTEFHNAPNRFEAGTGNIADAVGLGAAIQYVQRLGLDHIYRYEHELLDYATTQLKQIAGVKLIGTAKEKTSVLSFTLAGYSNDEVGQALNEVGIAVRTGHHCAQPILRRLGYESSVRPSLAFYNTYQEIDLLARTVDRLAWKAARY